MSAFSARRPAWLFAAGPLAADGAVVAWLRKLSSSRTESFPRQPAWPEPGHRAPRSGSPAGRKLAPLHHFPAPAPAIPAGAACWRHGDGSCRRPATSLLRLGEIGHQAAIARASSIAVKSARCRSRSARAAARRGRPGRRRPAPRGAAPSGRHASAARRRRSRNCQVGCPAGRTRIGCSSRTLIDSTSVSMPSKLVRGCILPGLSWPIGKVAGGRLATEAEARSVADVSLEGGGGGARRRSRYRRRPAAVRQDRDRGRAL